MWKPVPSIPPSSSNTDWQGRRNRLYRLRTQSESRNRFFVVVKQIRRIFLLLVFGAALPDLSAQTSPDLLWARRAGGLDSDTGYAVATDPSGNIYVAGAFYATNDFGPVKLVSAGLSDIFVAKYDADGNFLWARRAGGTSYDEARGVAVDGAGNACITGFFQLTANFAPTNLVSTGQSDVFVAKYDPAGNLQWARRAGGNDFEESHAIALDSS